MKRFQIYLTERQLKLLKSEAEQIGIPTAELIRRVFDGYLDNEKDTADARKIRTR